ncbi:MAG TPA: pirin family protein [Ferruginibacter sp.]|nr:pirin family protein [Ferruginibacter sp.]HRE62998.1 pirin family protein [Ferruginibacter sp.]
MLKKIEYILKGREKQITKEETVLQPLPHAEFRFANPFIVLHHQTPKYVQPGSVARIHPHPHRGFAPVTIMLQGEGFHQDNAGHSETISAGDVQWMFAGKGLLHSEGPSENILKNGGVQEFVQLWINVPQGKKLTNPFYQTAKAQEQPKVYEQNGVHLKLSVGEADGKTGPLKSFTPVTIFQGKIEAGIRMMLPAIPGYWTLLYIIKGQINVNQESVQEHNLIIFEKENDEIILCAEEDVDLLFLSAQPIDEPVAAKDNFVMNSMEEINQAMEDYKNGRFGTLNY